MDKNSNAFVLTEQQFKIALLRGAVAMGLISESRAERTLALLSEGQPMNEFVTIAENGAVIVLDEYGIALEGNPELSFASERADVPNEIEKTDDSDEGYSVDEVKKELVESRTMARIPSAATIRNWDASQRRKAIKWARAVARGKSSNDDRPDFIVEPLPRVRKPKPAVAETPTEESKVQSSEPESPNRGRRRRAEPEESTPNGAANSRFFDQPETSEE